MVGVGLLVGGLSAQACAAIAGCEEDPPAKAPESQAPAEAMDLPWPLPVPSSSMEIPRELCAPAEPGDHLTRASEQLARALHEAGYADLRYYDIPEGFAVVTRLELIDDQGLANAPTDPALRFGTPYPQLRFFTMRFWSRLVANRVGRFRLFVFVVLDHPFGYSKDVTDPEVVWKHPSSELPLDRADLPYKPEDKWFALVYEVENPPGSVAARLVPAPAEPALHLEKSGILAALQHVATPAGDP